MRKVAEPLKLTQSQVNNVGTHLKYPLDGAFHRNVYAIHIAHLCFVVLPLSMFDTSRV